MNATSRNSSQAVGGFALLVLLALAIDARAQTAKSGDPCVAVASSSGSLDASRDFTTLHRDFKSLVRPAPEHAIVLACIEGTTARAPNQILQSRIDLGDALTNASRDDEGIAVLDAVIATFETSNIEPMLRGDAHLRRGNAWRSLRDMKKAQSDYEAAQAALVESRQQETLLYAETLMGLSSVRHGALDLDGADRAIDEADALLQRLRMSRTRDAADILNQRTMIAYARQDFTATIRHAEAEMDVTRSLGGPDDRELLDPLATIGAIKSITGDFTGAEAALREGLRIADVRSDTTVDARLGILLNLATFYLDRVQPADAVPYAERALVLAEQHYGPDAAAVMRVHLTLAAVHTDLARYPEARRDYSRAAAMDERYGSSLPILQRLRLYLRRAQLDLKMGDRDEARNGLLRAERAMADQPKLGFWRGWQYRLACKLDAIEGDWRAADTHCAEAIAQYAGVLDAGHPLAFEALVGRCYAQTRGALAGDACMQVDERMRGAKVVNPKVRVLAFEALATRERALGHADAALDLYVKTLAAAEEIAVPDPLWAAHYALAETLAERGDRRLAIFFAKQSIQAIEDMRRHFDADRERQERGFLSDKLTVYRHLADWLLEEGRAPEAIDVLRMLKREEMYDYTERAANDDARAHVPYSRNEVNFAQTLDRLSTSEGSDGASKSAEIERLARLRDAKKISAEEEARLQLLLSGSRQREDVRAAEVKRFIVEQQAATAERREAMPPSSSRIASNIPLNAALGNDEANAYFFLADSRLHLIFAYKGGIARRVVDVDAQSLNRGIGDYLAAVSAREDIGRSSAAADLYTWLGDPLEREARARGIKRVHLWLDGALRYVPFAALWDGRNYLIERYEFSYLFAQPASTDGTVFNVARSESNAVPRALVAFGVTRALGGMPALPGVGEELCGIVNGPVSGLDGERAACAASGVARGELTGTGFANDWFTEARLRALMLQTRSEPSTREARSPRVDVLHVGTHFSLRPGNMQRSWLLMGDGAHLPLASFQQLDFTGLDLVTLSACQTGMAGAVGDDGREIEGLPTLIHQRGAQAVVASLWRIDDRSASELMRRFYAGLKRPHARVDEALRAAQLSMLRGAQGTHARPYYWAAFVPSVVVRRRQT